MTAETSLYVSKSIEMTIRGQLKVETNLFLPSLMMIWSTHAILTITVRQVNISITKLSFTLVKLVVIIIQVVWR